MIGYTSPVFILLYLVEIFFSKKKHNHTNSIRNEEFRFPNPKIFVAMELLLPGKNVGAFPTKRHTVSLRPESSDKWASVAMSFPGSNTPHQRLGVVSNELKWRELMRRHNLSLRLAS